jgi:hypothetical protein
MKRSAPSTCIHPTTYDEIVEVENDRHARRLRELKRAEKAIRAISDDLAKLAERRLFVDVAEYSMYLVDSNLRFKLSCRSKSALFLGTGLCVERGDRIANAFIDLGWQLQAVDVRLHYSQALLRRPKTQSRIVLDVTGEFAKSFQSCEVQK